MFPLVLNPAHGGVPILNASCPWASSEEDLIALYNSPFTTAVVTRTATLHGFAEDAAKHQMAFFTTANDANSSQASSVSSLNTYGYSPLPLSEYLSWLRPLLESPRNSDGHKKQVIVSITDGLEDTEKMLVILQEFANEMKVVLGVEYNASCPNIPSALLVFTNHPPPAYDEASLRSLIVLLSSHSSPNLKIGIKLPPYTYHDQFQSVINALSLVNQLERHPSQSPISIAHGHPISFLTITNTLGQGLVFDRQIREMEGSSLGQKQKKQEVTGKEGGGSNSKGEENNFALPGGIGGLAGDTIHQLSLGNVYKLSTMLKYHTDTSLHSIAIIGVGGVSDAAGVERMRMAGASAVACATALGRHGVSIFKSLAEDRIAVSKL